MSLLTPLHLLYFSRECLHHLERFPYCQTGYKISRAGTEFLDTMKKHWVVTHFISTSEKLLDSFGKKKIMLTFRITILKESSLSVL